MTVGAVEITFQYASQALTVTVKTAPAYWISGVPVFPSPLAGDAVSPGTRTCNFTGTPGFIVSTGVSSDDRAVPSISAAVIVVVPARTGVTEKTWLPLVSEELTVEPIHEEDN